MPTTITYFGMLMGPSFLVYEGSLSLQQASFQLERAAVCSQPTWGMSAHGFSTVSAVVVPGHDDAGELCRE